MYTHEIADTMSLTETAALVGVSERTIQRWTNAKKFVRPVTGWRFRRADVSAWVSGADALQDATRQLVEALSKVAHDPDESVQGRKWATARLVELSTGDPMALQAIARMASQI